MTDHEICEWIVKNGGSCRRMSCAGDYGWNNGTPCPFIDEKFDCENVLEQAKAWLAEHQKTCLWTEDEDGNWHTTCGEMHTFFDGGPSENGHRFCPYCGKKLVEKKYEESHEKDDDENCTWLVDEACALTGDECRGGCLFLAAKKVEEEQK